MGSSLAGIAISATTSVFTEIVNNWWRSDDPQSYQDGESAQATVDAQQIPAIQTAAFAEASETPIATPQELRLEAQHNISVDQERSKVVTLVNSQAWKSAVDTRWQSIYTSMYRTGNVTSTTALASKATYEVQANDFVRQESNLHLRYE